jgi:hypothetical protein
MSKKLKVPLLKGKASLYSIGFSALDNINTVTNWQEGNNVFLNVPDGRYFVFAKLKSGNDDEFLRLTVNVADAACQMGTDGFTNITPACKITTDGFTNISASSFKFTAILGYEQPIEQIACEILANPHTQIQEAVDRYAHHFSITAETVYAATVYSEAGEVSVDNGTTWNPLITLGYDASNRRLAGYKRPYTSPINPLLRTSAACSSYPDARNTEYFNFSFNFKTALTVTLNSNVSTINPEAFLIATHLSARQAIPEADAVFLIWLPGHFKNYRIRINQGQWFVGENKYLGPSTAPIEVSEISIQTGYPKDFIMDLTNDNGTTFDRFVVRRWSVGGHYSTVCSITRVKDNRVFVSTTIGDIGVQSRLVFDATTHLSHAVFQHCFDLGVQAADKTAVFGFEAENIAWATVKLLIEDYQ